MTGHRTIAAKAGFWSFSMKIFLQKETGKCLGLCCVMCIWEQRKCEKLFLQEKAVTLRYRGWTTSLSHYEATARDDCTIYSCLVVIKCDNVFGTYAELTIKCMPRIDIRLTFLLHRWFWLVRSLFRFYGFQTECRLINGSWTRSRKSGKKKRNKKRNKKKKKSLFIRNLNVCNCVGH
jgi:hypothetical protein